MQYMTNQRASDFVTKLVLNKHQRALVSNFSKYQVDDMIAEDDSGRKRDKILDDLSRGGSFGVFDDDQNWKKTNKDITEDPKLSQTQKDLLIEIREKFSPADVTADMCILFEVTSYKDESANPNFWEQYEDYTKVNDYDALVRPDKLKKKDYLQLALNDLKILGGN